MKAFAIYIAAVGIYTGTIIGVAQQQVSQIATRVEETKLGHPIAQIRKEAGLNVINSVKCFLNNVSIKSFYESNGIDSKACTKDGNNWEKPQ